MDVAEANKISTGQGITVAVVDSGVYPHPDLRRNLLSGTSFISSFDDRGQVDPVGHGNGEPDCRTWAGKSIRRDRNCTRS